MRWAAIGLTACVLAATVLAGAISGLIAAVFGSSDSPASAAALDDIPSRYLTLYRKAASLCPGLDWTVLAAIGKIETNHGRSALPGVHIGENFAGAGGPMQFLEPTFDAVTARHRLPPGGARPPSRYHPHDAIHAAAWLLCDNGARDDRDLRGAIFSYNHSDSYVRDVLSQAEQYRAAEPPSPRQARPGELDTTWPAQQPTEPDPTSSGQITPRTLTLVRALRATGHDGNSIGCHAPRPQNPDSDHPRGRACDIMLDPHKPTDVTEGWRIARWLIAHQARYGINYLIWQGENWSATQPRWSTYTSSAYGCPNPSNLTGCHYDHIHVSTY